MAVYEAELHLPKDGKKIWTEYMCGEKAVPNRISKGEPIVMSHAVFEDGTWVSAGVYNSGEADFNIKFMWVFDADGNRIVDVVDVSDHEDFLHSSYSFSLNDEDEETHCVKVVEGKKVPAAKSKKTNTASAQAAPASRKAPALKGNEPVVACIGEAYWHELPGGLVPGGMAANAAWISAQLGANAKIISAVGDDDAGKKYLAVLEERGLSTEGITVVPGAATPVAKTKVDAKGNASWKIKENAPWNAFKPSESALSFAAKASAVLCNSYFPGDGSSWKAFMDAVNSDAIKFLDIKAKPSLNPDLLKDALGRIKYFKCKEDESAGIATALGLKAKPDNNAAVFLELRGLYPSLEGEGQTARRGMTWMDQMFTFEKTNPPAPISNSIGAGDSIMAAVVMLLLNGKGDVRTNLKNIMRLVSVVCEAEDGMPALPPDVAQPFLK